MATNIRFNIKGYNDRRSAAELGSARALEQARADAALEALWRERVRQNEARRNRRRAGGVVAIMLGSALSGCATLEAGADHVRDFAVDHPVATAVGVAVVGGSIAIALNHHRETDAAHGAHGAPCLDGHTECRPD